MFQFFRVILVYHKKKIIFLISLAWAYNKDVNLLINELDQNFKKQNRTGLLHSYKREFISSLSNKIQVIPSRDVSKLKIIKATESNVKLIQHIQVRRITSQKRQPASHLLRQTIEDIQKYSRKIQRWGRNENQIEINAE